MARPKAEGLSYFPHDTDASGDLKIKPLLLLYGAKGYAFYFLHLEYIYRNTSLDLDISDAETRQIVCHELHLSLDEYEQILNTALNKGCFDKQYFNDTGKLTSEGIHKRAAVVLTKREYMSNRYQNKKVSAAETTPETTPEMGQSKVKESKENESKDVVVDSNTTIPGRAKEPEKTLPAAPTATENQKTELPEEKRPFNQEESSRIVAYYQKRIAGFSPTTKEYLDDWLSDVEPRVIELAIDEAVNAGVRNWNYIRTILVKWYASNIRTGDQAELHVLERQQQKANLTRGSPPDREALVKLHLATLHERLGDLDYIQFTGGPGCLCKGRGHFLVDEQGRRNPNPKPPEQWPIEEYQRYSYHQICPHVEINEILKKSG
jgi:DnaD/phage-associated family protein